MRLLFACTAAITLFFAACDSSPRASAPAAPSAASRFPAASDESKRLPKKGLTESKVVVKELMGKRFMPGGTIGQYRVGSLEYSVFIGKTTDPASAAFLLPDWQKLMADAKLIPSFGGYFGSDGGNQVFVFAKGVWIAGVSGLSQEKADGVARELATRLD